MKRTLGTLGLALAVFCLGLGTAQAEHADLMKAAQTFQQMVDEGQTADLMTKIDLYRVAGLSYQPSLVLPMEKILSCKNEEQIRTLAGMYTFDSNYALAMGNGVMALTTKQFVRDSLLPRLNVSRKLEIEPISQNLLKRLVENPNDPQIRTQVIAQATLNTKRIAELSADPEVMDLVVDTFFGSIIEGLYVACTLAKDAEMTPEMIDLFMEQLNRFESFDTFFHNFKDEQCLAFVEMADRDGLIHTVIDRLSETKGRLTGADIDMFLSLVEPVRAPLAKLCK